MWIYILIGLVILLPFGAIIAAFVLMSKNRKKQASFEEKYVRAEIVRTDVNARTMSVDTSRGYDHTGYFIELKSDQSETIVVTCNKRTFHTLLPGFYGDLVYKGTQLVSFIRLPEHEERRIEQKLEEDYSFVKREKKKNPIEFYCDAPSLNIQINSNEAILLDVDEVIAYVNLMFDNVTENFFVLDNKKQVIQFVNDGDKDDVIIDIPDIKRNGSYQALIKGENQTKSIVRAYYNDEDVFQLAEFEFMQF